MFEDFVSNPLEESFVTLKQDLVIAARDVYGSWNQDEEGFDELVGTGGICNLIADDFMDSATSRGFEASQFTDFEQGHTWCLVVVGGVWWNFDIPMGLYENQIGPCSYTKIEDVEFGIDDV